ncbi:hypothetical protein CALCODRAFT_497221 [Calocera cornea HHB12733]|uniref:Hemerythrin-like domain-containing protein n=1 Tax=Calocera cornea HHB12733 TaxID=1353952 RepID=A0A165FD86_9BASI|nr:hypothetical protein CALCODRAFT_497221 [Calocera cornea HHB12733]
MSSAESWPCWEDPVVIAARDFCLKVGMEQPPSDRYAWDRWNMAHVHTILMNRLEATYKNASHIAANDYATYWAVAYADVHFVLDHHVSEEEFYFPCLTGGIMEPNTKQHAEFAKQVEDTLMYLGTVDPSKQDSQPFSASAFRASIEVWLRTGAQHMHDELTTLEAENLKQAGVTLQQLEDAIKSVAKHRAETEDVHALPAMMYADPGTKFPSDAPWFVPNLLAPAMAYATGLGRMKYYWKARRWETTAPNAHPQSLS